MPSGIFSTIKIHVGRDSGRRESRQTQPAYIGKYRVLDSSDEWPQTRRNFLAEEALHNEGASKKD